MTLNIIKLNPSQELKLKKKRADFFGKSEPLELDKKSGLIRQRIVEGRAIFLEPLLCVLPEDFGKEEFRALESLEIFPPKKASQAQESAADKNSSQAQEAAALYYFPALVKSGGRQFNAAIPCAFDFALAQNFDLQKIFAAAQDISQDQSAALIQNIPQAQEAAPQSDADKKSRGQDLVLAPTSFYFARAEITQNTWSLYDALWKKLL